MVCHSASGALEGVKRFGAKESPPRFDMEELLRAIEHTRITMGKVTGLQCKRN